MTRVNERRQRQSPPPDSNRSPEAFSRLKNPKYSNVTGKIDVKLASKDQPLQPTAYFVISVPLIYQETFPVKIFFLACKKTQHFFPCQQGNYTSYLHG
ncbi:hypothetical protein NL676_001659 [Syzygium grande]|nr:hypothetical protein NL676_001659 [Syzygium grande]